MAVVRGECERVSSMHRAAHAAATTSAQHYDRSDTPLARCLGAAPDGRSSASAPPTPSADSTVIHVLAAISAVVAFLTVLEVPSSGRGDGARKTPAEQRADRSAERRDERLDVRRVATEDKFARQVERHGEPSDERRVETIGGPSGGPRRLVLAHYMPWFAAKNVSRQWGWHWTMNSRDPDRLQDGRPQIASHFQPLIGPYDSHDPAVVEYHLLLMKLAGIDGVIVDWYGLENFRDYAMLHRNTQTLLTAAERYGLKFAVCYEDQTIPALVKEGRLAESRRIPHAAAELEWLAKNWFSSPAYVRLDDKPLLLSFGQNGLTDQEWTAVLKRLQEAQGRKGVQEPQRQKGLQGLKGTKESKGTNEPNGRNEANGPNTAGSSVSYFSLHHRRTAAVGAFDWPLPSQGLKAVDRFLQTETRGRTPAIPVAFPRFVDYYAEAKVGPSYGRIDDADGATLRTTARRALDAGQPIVQIATWNDWGEGTQIEPSREHGYRDLEILQTLRRETIEPGLKLQPSDLRLPFRLFTLRGAAKSAAGSDRARRLDAIAQHLARRETREAATLLDKFEPPRDNADRK